MTHSLAQQHQLGYAGLEPFSVALAQFAQGQAASAYFNSVGAGVNGGQFGWPAPGSMGQAGGYGPYASFGQFMGSAPSYNRPWNASGSGGCMDGLPSNTPSLDNAGTCSGLPDMPSSSQQQQMGMNAGPQAGSGPSCWPGAQGASNATATGLLPPPSWRSSGTKLQQPSSSGRTTNDGTTMAVPQHLHLHSQQHAQPQFAYPLASGISVPSAPSGVTLTSQRPAGPWMGVLPTQQAPGGVAGSALHSTVPPSGDELVMHLLRGDAPGQQQATPGVPSLVGLAQQTRTQQQLSMLQERQLSHAAAGPSATAAPKAHSQQTQQQSADSMKAQLGERNYYVVRSMLVRQQETFISQVWELHRLHRTQRYLMKELASPEHALTAHYEAQASLPKPAAAAADAAALKHQEAAAATKAAAIAPAEGTAAAQPQAARLPLAKAVAMVQAPQKAAAAAAAAPLSGGQRPSDALSTLTAHIHLMACIPASIRKVFQAPEPASGSDDAAACLAEEAPRSPPVEPLDAKDFWLTKEAVGVVRPVASRIQLNAAGTMSGDTTVQAAPGSPAALGASVNPQAHAASKPTPLRAATNADSALPQMAPMDAPAAQPAKQLPSLPLPPAAPLMAMRSPPMPVASGAGAAVSNSMQRPGLPPSSVMLLQQQQQQQQVLLFQQQQAQQHLLLQQQAQVTAAAAAAAAAGPSQAAAEQRWADGAAATAAASRAVPTDSAAAGLNLFRPTPQISPMFASRFLSGQQSAQQLPPLAGANAGGFDPHAFWFAKHCEARQGQQAAAAATSAGQAQAQKRVGASHGLPPHPGSLAGQPGRAGLSSQAAAAPQLLPMQPPPAVNPATHHAARQAAGAAAPAASGQQRHNVLRWWQDPAAAFGEPGLVDPEPKLGPGGTRHHSPPNGGEVTSALTGPSSSKPSSLKRPTSHGGAAPLKKRVKYGLDGVTRSPELPHSAADEEAVQKHRAERPRSRSKSPHKVSPHKGTNTHHVKGLDKRSAFKRVVPTKVRSKRGSNRARTESIGSDNSTSSIDKGGKAAKDEPKSVVGGKGAVAPAPSVTVTATAPVTSGMVSHAGHQSTAKSAAGILLSLSSSFHGP